MRKIIIKSSGYIPFIQGNGPILKPVTVSESQYNTLKTMGFDIQEVGSEGKVVKATVAFTEPKAAEMKNPPSTVSESDVQTVVDDAVEVEEVVETAPEEEVAEEVELEEEVVVETAPEEEEVAEEVELEEEIVEEEVVVEEEIVEEEILVDDEDLSAEAFYNEDFLTKAKAKVILEARGVDFEGSANATELKQLVLSSNPEVSE